MATAMDIIRHVYADNFCEIRFNLRYEGIIYGVEYFSDTGPIEERRYTFWQWELFDRFPDEDTLPVRNPVGALSMEEAKVEIRAAYAAVKQGLPPPRLAPLQTPDKEGDESQ